jgi:hypothetical protein
MKEEVERALSEHAERYLVGATPQSVAHLEEAGR